MNELCPSYDFGMKEKKVKLWLCAEYSQARVECAKSQLPFLTLRVLPPLKTSHFKYFSYFEMSYSVHCSTFVWVEVCALRCHWKFATVEGGEMSKCQGGRHVETNFLWHAWRRFEETGEKKKIKLLIRVLQLECLRLVKIGNSANRQRFSSFSPFRFRRIVHQEWSGANAAQFFFVQSHRPTVSAQPLILLLN